MLGFINQGESLLRALVIRRNFFTLCQGDFLSTTRGPILSRDGSFTSSSGYNLFSGHRYSTKRSNSTRCVSHLVLNPTLGLIYIGAGRPLFSPPPIGN